jgi:hypothetical protein
VRFVVHVAILNGDDGVLTLLDRLVDRLSDEVHLVEVPDADRLEESSWYRQARPTLRKVLTSSLAKPARIAQADRGPHVRTIELHDAESTKLAAKLAYAPLVVLVEDREADGVLLDILVEELGWPELQALWQRGRSVTPRAMEFNTAGGVGGIPLRIERIARNAAEENRPSRLYVLCDCDARWPGDDERRRPVDAVRRACTNHGVPHHVWRKRSAENYIPDPVFESVRDDPRNSGKAERFNALLRRSREQRDYFPVKDGLKAPERSLAIAAGLYMSSELEDLEPLETRLFAKSPRPVRLLSEQWREAFTAEGLRARDGNGELDSLLLSISLEL